MSMNPNEQSEFLTKSRCIAKISTLEKDGTMHIVPVWYMYNGQNFVITSDATSRHIKNIRRDNKTTILIDTVQFPTKGVRAKGNATLEEDEMKVHNFEVEITQRYITDKTKAADYVKKREGKSKRVAIVVIPEKLSSWDFSKNLEEKEFFKDSPVYSLNG